MIYFWLTAPESGWSAFEGDVTWNRRIESCARQNWRRIYPRDVDLPEADIERLEAIEAELDQIEADGEAADAPDTALEERIAVLNAEYEAIDAKGRVFEPEDVARSRAILSVDQAGTLVIVRGLVRLEDEPKPEESSSAPNTKETIEEDDEEKPSGLPDRLAVDLRARRTMAMRDQLGVFPDMAHAVVTHALALQLFYYGQCHESCLSLIASSPALEDRAAGIGESLAAKNVGTRHEAWAARMPSESETLWPFILALKFSERRQQSDISRPSSVISRDFVLASQKM